MQRIVLISLIAVCLISCDVLNSSDNAIKLSSDQLDYAIGEPVVITIKNELPNSIFFLRRCNLDADIESVTIEKKIHGKWEDGEQPIGCVGLVPPIEIKPGEKHSFEGIFNEPGIYRYRLGLYKTEDGERLLPESQRRSNAFTIQSE